MPKIQIKLDPKAIARYSDVTFAPGDPMAVTIDGRDIPGWCGIDPDQPMDDPGISCCQDEVLRDFIRDGVTLEIAEDGTIGVVEI